MAHNGDVCPHLREQLTSQIIASFFSEPLIVSHFLSHYQFVKLDSIHTAGEKGICAFALSSYVTWLNLLHTAPQYKHRHTSTIKWPHLSLSEAARLFQAESSVPFVGRYKKTHTSLRRNKVNIIYYFSIPRTEWTKLDITNSSHCMFQMYQSSTVTVMIDSEVRSTPSKMLSKGTCVLAVKCVKTNILLRK